MASDPDTDETFDEEELAEGFDEELGEDEIDDDSLEDDGDSDADGDDETEEEDLGGEDVVEDDEEPVATAIAVDDDDIVDDSDVELALDEVLAETIMRTSVSDDDDETTDVDPTLDPAESILPKQDDEFRCSSCRLLKKTSQLADRGKMLCRDCV